MAGAHRGAAVRCVAVTPGGGGADQGTLFTGEDGYVRAWRAADGAPLCALAGHRLGRRRRDVRAGEDAVLGVARRIDHRVGVGK